MTNGQNVARSRHLEELANAAKRYTLREILDVTEAVAAELGGLSSPNYEDFTGATSIAGGISGLVPAPSAGDNGKFLRGDGVWATVESGSSGGAIDYVIGSAVSSVEGGFWQDTFNDTPVLKLRHGDYEYIFAYDNLTYLGGASSVLETVTPNTYVLGTASVSNDGGVWYEVNNDVPTLNLHKGNFNYSFNYDRITYKGDNSNLAAYLPFNVSPTMDACGNTWTATGTPMIVDDAIYFNSSSNLTNSTILDSVGAQPWTIDFWVVLFADGIHFLISGVSGSANGLYLMLTGGVTRLYLPFISTNVYGTIPVSLNTRHHYAATYDGSKIRVFVDGVLDIEWAGQCSLAGTLNIAPNGYEQKFDHFRVFKGQALWTSDFTPPTAEDYL